MASGTNRPLDAVDIIIISISTIAKCTGPFILRAYVVDPGGTRLIAPPIESVGARKRVKYGKSCPTSFSGLHIRWLHIKAHTHTHNQIKTARRAFEVEGSKGMVSFEGGQVRQH